MLLIGVSLFIAFLICFFLIGQYVKMPELGYRPDTKKAVKLYRITALKSQLRINILVLGIPTIIEG